MYVAQPRTYQCLSDIGTYVIFYESGIIQKLIVFIVPQVDNVPGSQVHPTGSGRVQFRLFLHLPRTEATAGGTGEADGDNRPHVCVRCWWERSKKKEEFICAMECSYSTVSLTPSWTRTSEFQASWVQLGVGDTVYGIVPTPSRKMGLTGKNDQESMDKV